MRLPGAPPEIDCDMTEASATEKSRLRAEAMTRRDALSADQRQAASEAIAARPFPLPIRTGTIVSGFMPLKSEINPLPLLRKLAGESARLALPVIGGRGQPLVMREWTWGEPLAAGVWGIREPLAQAPAVDPDIVLTPLLAFDRARHRLGYGGGYYDLTIAQLRGRKTIVAVGLAFAVQEVFTVPVTPRDAPLDLVLTEREVIDFRDG
jgi:5-formyltetrahydrofolate cyclo-ligase